MKTHWRESLHRESKQVRFRYYEDIWECLRKNCKYIFWFEVNFEKFQIYSNPVLKVMKRPIKLYTYLFLKILIQETYILKIIQHQMEKISRNVIWNPYISQEYACHHHFNFWNLYDDSTGCNCKINFSSSHLATVVIAAKVSFHLDLTLKNSKFIPIPLQR